MSAANSPTNYGKIWVILVALVFVGVAALQAPSHTTGVVLIFAAALVKAVIVLRYYMHVVNQPKMVYALLAIPLFLAFMMGGILVTDIAGYHREAPSSGAHGSAH